VITVALLFAYLGPDTLLPLTSGLAGVAGACLIFGKSVVRLLLDGTRRLVRLFGARS
jgi:hypothetical protein